MAYDNLYSPWRSKYFTQESDEKCVFCAIAASDRDRENHIFYRDSVCFGVMNLYPYMPGHFMIIPYKHVDSPTLLSQDEWLHISVLAQNAIILLEEYGARGVNMGINIKKAAGAGIPNHLHLHFVPRYEGDTNFITTIGNSRVYGVDFEEIFEKVQSLAKIHFKVK
ncbi:HIT family hydrolase [Helicobacter didelphidarum]|uniref:HIT family hydrolase n=1 Tax=Helicobacter didelphidarum TaxID=2040648 RepID=A0A3D8IR54_9HELI|nr:HIT domain-containing protein [Helicobacter didelphidarum]RDU67692.1 HIT family hydrolase [Helicobacter didelphidarum]